jgi:hypothetical protein
VEAREAPDDEFHRRSILSHPFRPNRSPPTAAEIAVSRNGDDERPARSVAPARRGTDNDADAPGCRGGGSAAALAEDEVEDASDFVGSGELRYGVSAADVARYRDCNVDCASTVCGGVQVAKDAERD